MSMVSKLEGTKVGVTGSDVAHDGVAISPVMASSPPVGWASEDRAADRLDVAPGTWIASRESDGEVAIHDPRLFRPGREAFCRALAVSAVERFQARCVAIDLTTSTCRLVFEPGAFDREELARRVEAAVRAAIPVLRERVGAAPPKRAAWIALTAHATGRGVAIRRRYVRRPGHKLLHDTPSPGTPAFEGPKAAPRLVDLALAGGSFTMVVAAVILPGIPTLPFLVMTARHTVRLSPRIERLLRRRAWSAALLNHSEDAGIRCGFEWRSHLKMALITVLVVAALLIAQPPMPFLVALEVAVMACVCLRKLGRADRRPVALGVAA